MNAAKRARAPSQSSLGDSALFVRHDYPAPTNVARRRAELLADADLHLAALLDRLGGPGWDALQAAHPSAAALDAYQPWMFPVSMEQVDARNVRIGLASPSTPNEDPSPLIMFGSCLSALALGAEYLRQLHAPAPQMAPSSL